jgi:hypothetical protein
MEAHMSNGFSAEWHDHQKRFLEFKLKDLALMDAGLKRVIGSLIKEYSPPKLTVRVLLLKLVGKEVRVCEDPVRTSRLDFYKGLKQAVYGSAGRAAYKKGRKAYKAESLAEIAGGRSISPFVQDIATAAADTRKAKRFMQCFRSLTFDLVKHKVVAKFCEFVPVSNSRRRFDYRTFESMWSDRLAKHIPVDQFFGYNETQAFAELDLLFTSAGASTEYVRAGTECSHGGVVPKDLVLDDAISCWTSLLPAKFFLYAGFAVESHEKTPVKNALPQVIIGTLKVDLNCGVMRGTSFHNFTNTFCNHSHDVLKTWLTCWCAERGFDGLIGTNRVDDELVIMNPLSNVTWRLWVMLPETQVELTKQYGQPPYFPYRASKSTPRPTPPASAPTP